MKLDDEIILKVNTCLEIQEYSFLKVHILVFWLIKQCFDKPNL